MAFDFRRVNKVPSNRRFPLVSSSGTPTTTTTPPPFVALDADTMFNVIDEDGGVKAPITSFYTVSFIKLIVSSNGTFYNIDQLGDTQNPNLTCYRGTNYRFYHEQDQHPLALRTELNNVHDDVPGAVDNDVKDGITNSIIYFTPNDETPDTIYYQCTVHPNMKGTITILNYE